MGHSLKDKRQEYKNAGAFYTPEKTALYIRGFLPEKITEVYDPTCGGGGLLRIFGDDVVKYGQEIEKEAFECCQNEIVNFVGYCGDTLTDPAWMGKKFDAIIANPPFSIKWSGKDNPANKEDIRFKDAPVLAPNSKADYAFILHILHYLSDTGTASVLEFPGILYRGNAEGKIRQWLVEQNYIDTVVGIPAGEFEDTSVSTVLLVLKKNKTTTDIKFIDKENDLERVVSFEEIKNNNFNLSVSTYVQKEEEKEEIDIVELNKEVNERTLNGIKKSLSLIGFVYATFPEDYTDTYDDFLNKVGLLIEEARDKFTEFRKEAGVSNGESE